MNPVNLPLNLGVESLTQPGAGCLVQQKSLAVNICL